ncbi:zinc finger protein 502-like [Aricia agestis]|uniref:zinc finger protein 502-like n=1 Tax=Aricia agestis TaxID=91739 RepID=UPI001C201BB3|nr:zinc finger protein 502-like [Aricia agestis]
MEQKQSFLCRICLKVGATHPIFEGDGESCVLNKLKMCLNEKLEDIDGYPRNICMECNEILDTLCSFVKKFKSTNTILQNGLCIKRIKKEPEECNRSEEDLYNVEIKLEDVKYELESGKDSDFSDNDNISYEPPKPLTSKKRPVKSKSLVDSKNEPKNKISKSSCSRETKNTNKTTSKETKCSQKKTVVKSHEEKAPPGPRLCHLCGDVFQTPKEFSSHNQKKHNQSEVKCPHCEKTLVSNYYLLKHIKRLHGGPRDFSCTKCGKAFAFQNCLTSHMRQVHNKKVVEKKSFTCKICNKVYTCEKSVIIHERSVHTGERPAVCKVCGSSFFHNEYLIQHMRLHTGATPFKCPVCDRGYAQKGNMKSHLRNHRKSELDSDKLSKIKPNLLKFFKP